MNTSNQTTDTTEPFVCGSLRLLMQDMAELTDKLNSFHLSLMLKWQKGMNNDQKHTNNITNERNTQ